MLEQNGAEQGSLNGLRGYMKITEQYNLPHKRRKRSGSGDEISVGGRASWKTSQSPYVGGYRQVIWINA